MYMYMYNEYRSYKYIFSMTLDVKQHIGWGRVSRRTENKTKNSFDKTLASRLFNIGPNTTILGIIGWPYWGRNWSNLTLNEEKKPFLIFSIWENLAGLKNQSLYTPLPWNFCKIEVIIFIGRVARVSNFN